MTKGFTLKVPGGRYKENPFICYVPAEKADSILSAVKKRYPYVVFFDPTVEEQVQGDKDPDKEPDKEPDKAPEKDEFFAACSATKIDEDTWKVTLPDGKELQIDGVSHHKQAKQVAYEKTYGEIESSEN